MTPSEVVEEVIASDCEVAGVEVFLGMSGGQQPTGSPTKYVICNGDKDVGAFMDRSIMEATLIQSSKA